MPRRIVYVITVVTLGLIYAMGCWPETYAADEYREAIPQQDDLKVRLGSGDTSDGTQEQAELDEHADCPDCCIETDQYGEEWYVDGEVYTQTREAQWHVNGGLVVTMGWVEAIVNAPITEETSDGYIWGPWTEDLSRISFRFVMDKDSGDRFSFRLEGKHINDDSDNWQTVVDGQTTSDGEPYRVVGSLMMDFDAIHDIDSAHPSFGAGKVFYEFDVRDYPYTVEVEFDGLEVDDEIVLDADYTYTRYEGEAGMFHFIAEADFWPAADEVNPRDPDGIVETYEVESRWDTTGAGKGTASIYGGSFDGDQIEAYTLTECWADKDGAYYENYDHGAVTYADGQPPFDEVNCGDLANCPTFD